MTEYIDREELRMAMASLRKSSKSLIALPPLMLLRWCMVIRCGTAYFPMSFATFHRAVNAGSWLSSLLTRLDTALTVRAKMDRGDNNAAD